MENPKLKRYKVTMWTPSYSYIDARDEDDALDRATDADEWEGPHWQGEEKYDVEEVKEK